MAWSESTAGSVTATSFRGAPGDSLPDAAFSFPGLGAAAPANVAFALFSFPSVEAYDQHREAVGHDDACKAATARFHEAVCFSGYERSFLVPIFDESRFGVLGYGVTA